MCAAMKTSVRIFHDSFVLKKRRVGAGDLFFIYNDFLSAFIIIGFVIGMLVVI